MNVTSGDGDEASGKANLEREADRVLLFGGTFNPVHIGHLHLAATARALGRFRRLEFLPSHAPRHKSGGLLPFETRVALLEAAIAGIDGFGVNTIERELEAPSFTIRTFEALASKRPEIRPHFLLGHPEFLRLHLWHRGRDLAKMTNFVVAAREGYEARAFADQLAQAWPESREVPPDGMGGVRYEILSGRFATVIAPALIDLSSTRVRGDWLAGRSVEELVPEGAFGLMQGVRRAIDMAWAASPSTLKPTGDL